MPGILAEFQRRFGPGNESIRNAGNQEPTETPAKPSDFLTSSIPDSSTPETLTLDDWFISNVDDEFYQLSPGEMLGAPHATESLTVEQLQAQGISGLYRRKP